jgi:Ca-activated chloride channel family protein
MAAADFGGPYGVATRIQAVKSVVNEFIDGRVGDRVGLVVFGSNSYLQSPLTLDHTVVKSLVSRLQVGMAGDGTAIGDGLGLALKRVQGVEGDSRAIILLTDGVSNAGKVNPLQAARVARDLQIKVHTIGIGKRGSGGFFTLPGRLSLPQSGRAEFDERTLKLIAEITGGVYFNASNIQDLQKVYKEIDKLEKIDAEIPTRKEIDERYAMYAAWGMLFFLLYLAFSRTYFLRVP